MCVCSVGLHLMKFMVIRYVFEERKSVAVSFSYGPRMPTVLNMTQWFTFARQNLKLNRMYIAYKMFCSVSNRQQLLWENWQKSSSQAETNSTHDDDEHLSALFRQLSFRYFISTEKKLNPQSFPYPICVTNSYASISWIINECFNHIGCQVSGVADNDNYHFN